MNKKMVLLITLFFISCAVATKVLGPVLTKYFGHIGIGKENYSSIAHYIYEDDSLVFAAQIRSGGLSNQFWYHFLIMNNGVRPINMNWEYDVLFLEYQGKTYQLIKETPISVYPNSLNPETSVMIGFPIERRFNNTINDIERLKFQFNDELYILDKNPNANWQ